MAGDGARAARTILHVDMDAFYASVEQLRRPELRGRPVVVGGTGSRGVVAAASYEARAYGVHSAMPSLRAKAMCPDAVFVAGDHAHYAEVSGRIMEIFRSVTPLVEPLSLDEAFLDVTGARRLLGDGRTIAAHIRSRVFETESLTCSVGVAPSKFLAKLATEHGKPKASATGPIPGSGITVVPPGDERAFLRPLPIRALWGVGPKTGEKLHRLGVRTIGELAALPLEVVIGAVGDASGRHLHALAHAVDGRPVVPDARPKSISHEETFAVDIDDRDTLGVHLVRMADAVSSRARAHAMPGRTVSIKVRFGDFSTITRSVTLHQPVDTASVIVSAARGLLEDVDVGVGVRLFGVGLSNLAEAAPQQLSLGSFDDVAGPEGAGSVATEAGRLGDDPGRAAVADAVDAVRRRFGDDSVMPATLVAAPGTKTGDRRVGRFRPGQQQWGPNARPDTPDEPQEDDHGPERPAAT